MDIDKSQKFDDLLIRSGPLKLNSGQRAEQTYKPTLKSLKVRGSCGRDMRANCQTEDERDNGTADAFQMGSLAL